MTNLPSLTIRIIDYNSGEYRAALALRDEVLRQPLGLRLSAEDTAGEESQIHIGAFHEGKLVGCTILAPQEGGIAKMRQVAVDQTIKGLGTGRALVTFFEDYARQNHYHKITLHARKAVEPFYKKLGYTTIGDEFTERSIPHIKMMKVL